MGIMGFSAKVAASVFSRRIRMWEKKAVSIQEGLMLKLIEKGGNTVFGRDHSLSTIKTYENFRKAVPLGDYESLRVYIDRVRSGESNVLWPGRPIYFARTSGTTSGSKYIPITDDSMPNQINGARLSLLNYIFVTGKTGFLSGKYIFLSGSPVLEEENGIPAGRLSGIVNHHVPLYLRRRQLPSPQVNCIEEWDIKLDAIVGETVGKNMSLISGIPPWVEMYFERLLERSGRSSVLDLFPGFGLYVYGGVNFRPYEQKFRNIIGGNVDLLETFPASEGFFAFQDRFPGEGLLLIPDSGIFYEFIPLEEFNTGNFERIPLAGVKPGVNYVMVLNTNAGLWGYNLGDTVKFLSVNPFRLVVTGRVSQCTSAFGEHVIVSEVESAINEVCRITGARITEFTVAPLVDNPSGLPCHEWFIEFSKLPDSIDKFGKELDLLIRNKNSYYNDLVKGKIIQPLVIRIMPPGSFAGYMKSIGKLGGQNKVPHLSNDRDIASALLKRI